MMFATSCENELDLGTNARENAQVTFSVRTPEIATRAYSDGQTATVLQYAVYDAAGNQLTDLTVTDAEIHGSTTVNLQLTTGNTYSVIFWAAAENAPYTVDFDAKTMTVDYSNAVSNDETRDAFYKYHTFTVTGTQTETIELKRPFAQLNIGTADYAASTSAGYTPTKSAVTVKNIYSTLNLATGAVDGSDEATFNFADIKKDETFPVAGNEYLAMNYLLVGADKETVEVEFSYTDGSNAKTRTVGSVPVQRNYRTNIYGNLLTSDVDINVEIKPDYNEPAHEADALMLAAAIGGEFSLTENVELTKPLNIQANMVLNLNGYTISGANEKGNGAVVNVAEGITVEIYGGEIKSTAQNGDAAINNAGNLVLRGVAIEGAPLADGGYSAYAVISSGIMVIENGTEVSAERGSIKVIGAGETVINGGTFTNKDISPRSLTSHVVDVEDGSTHKLTINGGTFQHLHAATSGGVVICNRTKGTVYVNGGNFSGGNYYGNDNLSDYGYGGTFAVKGGVFSAKPAAKYMVAGYKAVENNGKYYVVAEEADAVATNTAELNDALANGDNVALVNDIEVAKSEAGSNGYGATGISQLNGGVIDGNGNDISVNAWGTWDSAINTTGGTIKNLNVTGGMRGIFVNHNSTNNSKVILENVTIDGTVYTISCDQGTNQGLEAYNSTFNGWTSYAATIGAVKFDGCSFGEGQGYAFCRPYAATEFVNCDFAAGYEIEADAAITFENCTIDGVALTAANLATLVPYNTANATVK